MPEDTRRDAADRTEAGGDGEAAGGDGEAAGASSARRSDWTKRTEVGVAVLAGLSTLFAAVAAVVTLQVQANQGRTEVDVTRQGQITDRFNVAVGNLGDRADEVRLGGIFALRRIMEDSPRDQPAVVDVLSAYVRTHAPAAGGGKTKRDAAGRPAPDVRAAFETLAERDPDHDKSSRVDLRDTYLRYIGVRHNANGPEGTGPQLADANLSGAVLSDAQLSRTRLSGTYLVGTRMEDADLRGADLSDADLRGAKLAGADLRGADLRGARLRAGDAADGDDKSGSGKRAKVSGSPAEVSVEQLLTARLDRTTVLPFALKRDPRIRDRLSGEQAH
ncbi:pentapeptide repeat-containing protein [Streptomyces sp. G5(2025)]|uniref:pentapeptide repeat-containing protein n=1 Tax=Streptomyces sp. G5(2025) TaxID=3406628 RepID=UPI003C1CB3C3